ncbi:HEPN domain-containing protein [Pseudomonas sp. TH15]|uniref:HEPN domain-containing protein n=1 Tax=Pseudomonas sp. TH15 TaxID=2796381 RepID=UPI001914447B|nr:HEPN domain-containing protein [Pseudomonas sp. TH15]MBK5511703.1 hypothetical protein [Pseudomonas sp. TH15]
MNTFSACAELANYLKEQDTNDKSAAYIASAAEEILSCWSNDPVAEELLYEFGDIKATLKNLKSENLNQSQLTRLSIFCRAVASRQKHYAPLLHKTLQDAIFGSSILTQKERITSQIDNITGLFITHLVYLGYSPTYLFHKAKLLARIGNYGNRSATEQFEHILGKLVNNNKKEHIVYFGIQTRLSNQATTDEFNAEVEILEEMPEDIKTTKREKLEKNFQPNSVAKVKCSATDHVSAAILAKEKLDKFIDLVTAFEIKGKVYASPHGIVTFRSSDLAHTYQEIVNVDLLLTFISSEVGVTRSTPEIRKVFSILTPAAKDQLGRSLRYLRLSRTATTLEQKLLNLWIALESLFSSQDTTILAYILEYVPSIYAINGLVRRLEYAKELLQSNEIGTTDPYRQRINPAECFDDTTNTNHIYALLRDKAAGPSIFNNLNDFEHIKFRLMKLKSEFESDKSIAERILKTEKDVTRQLRRIYFLRNKIAHTGHFEGVRPQLITHLYDYIICCYEALSHTTSKVEIGESYSINDLLSSVRLGLDSFSSKLRDPNHTAGLPAHAPII